MKAVVGTSLALLFLCSCGGQEQLDLRQGQADYFNEDNKKECIKEPREGCNEPIVASLVPFESTGYSPRLKFVAKDRDTYLDAKVDAYDPTLPLGKCIELYKHLCGRAINAGASITPNALSIETGFNPTAEQEKELLLGKAVSVRPNDAKLTVTDGSLNSVSTDVELRCPEVAQVTCKVSEMGDYKKCESYQVKYTGSCTFRSEPLLYSFRDHKKAQLDVQGKLKVSPDRGAEIIFTKIVWD